MQGFAGLLILQAGLRKWQLEVPSLTSWVYCFLAHIVVQTSEAATRNMLAYCRLIIHEALHHGGRDGRSVIGHFGNSRKFANPCPGTHCWLTYKHLQYWDKDKNGTFCTTCQGVDHSNYQCASLALMTGEDLAWRQVPFRKVGQQWSPVCKFLEF